ncbi:hypothetical protein AN958_02713 [Leucoagaricus sp. SymC.cos]|nr:hypothetical protein AN958_02713 [Leucoagaricus sp. SymC.cos]
MRIILQYPEPYTMPSGPSTTESMNSNSLFGADSHKVVAVSVPNRNQSNEVEQLMVRTRTLPFHLPIVPSSA